jgi:hypothetical protein
MMVSCADLRRYLRLTASGSGMIDKRKAIERELSWLTRSIILLRGGSDVYQERPVGMNTNAAES